MPNLAYPNDNQPWPAERYYRDAPLWSPTTVVGSQPAAGTSAYGSGPLALSFSVAGSVITPAMGLGRARVMGMLYERTVTPWTSGMTGTAPTEGSDPYPLNTSTQPRIDRLVLRRDLAAGTCYPLILQGTPAASPALPGLAQDDKGVWDMPLFNWRLAGNSSTAISNIVDERPWRRAPIDWGRIDGTSLPTPADGIIDGDTAYITLWRCRATFIGPERAASDPTVPAGRGSWRQIGVTQVLHPGDLADFRAALAAAGGTFHNGFLVFDMDADRLFVSPGGTTLNLVSGTGGGAVAAGFAQKSDWVLNSATTVRNMGNGMAFLQVDFTRANTDYAVTANGDVVNAAITTLPAGWLPAVTSPLTASSTGRMVSGSIDQVSGDVILAATTPGQNIIIGQRNTLAGYYALANPSVGIP